MQRYWIVAHISRHQRTYIVTYCEDFVRNQPVFRSVVPAGSSSRGEDVVVFVRDIHEPSLPTPFYSVVVSISVFMALSTVSHSMNSPDNSPLSHSVLPVLILPHWSFQLSPYESLPQP